MHVSKIVCEFVVIVFNTGNDFMNGERDVYISVPSVSFNKEIHNTLKTK
jgi:hypothetical protein